MHPDTIISMIVASGTAALGLSGVAGAAADVAILISLVFAGVAGYEVIRTWRHRRSQARH